MQRKKSCINCSGSEINMIEIGEIKRHIQCEAVMGPTLFMVLVKKNTERLSADRHRYGI